MRIDVNAMMVSMSEGDNYKLYKKIKYLQSTIFSKKEIVILTDIVDVKILLQISYLHCFQTPNDFSGN